MNSQNEHLIKHAQDGIEKCFDRIEKIEENIKDIKIYSNPLQEKVWQENIIKRFEKLEKFHDEFKNILKEDIEEYQEIHEAIENRLTKLESSKLTQELDPKVWVHIHERLDRVESKTMLMIDVEENLKQWRWVHEQIARLDLVIKAKEFGVQMEEGNRYMEVVSGLELKLLDKINDVIKMMVKEDLKNEDHNIKLELRLEKLEKLFTDDIEEIHRVLEEHRKSFIAPRLAPFKCPVCDGLGTRCIYAHIPNQTCTCVTCKGKGIVWSE
jgi:hypothetical protein